MHLVKGSPAPTLATALTASSQRPPRQGPSWELGRDTPAWLGVRVGGESQLLGFGGWWAPWKGQEKPEQTLASREAVFRSNLSHLLELMGSGKESLIFMKKRTKRLTAQWATAVQRLAQKLGDVWRDQKQILVHIGFLTEESGDVFSPRVLKGGPLGEMVQWADILAALYILGHSLRVTVSLKELQRGAYWTLQFREGGREKSLKLCVTKEMLLLSVTTAYTGLELTFFSGVYGTCIGAINRFGTEEKSLIGLSGIFIGIGEILGGSLFGLLSKNNRFGRNPVVLLGILVHFIAFYLIFLNMPGDAPIAPVEGTNSNAYIRSSKEVAILCSFLLGLGDSCFNTQLLSILGFLYSEDSAPAFAIFKFVQSICAAVAFFYSNYLLLHWQLLVMVVFGFFGTISFFTVEWDAAAIVARGSDYRSI
ncbi:Hypothetical predicted protein [Marmota monax]|uniref:UNC93-like protein MFSD11 n=1 Tax=Marmota monax TaxID=9995 RepID=A0A5E4AGF7_MARMO|nr:Hypothetical predicted protein [Marmota monax]